eukprot:933880-Amphidinium_carterae.1
MDAREGTSARQSLISVQGTSSSDAWLIWVAINLKAMDKWVIFYAGTPNERAAVERYSPSSVARCQKEQASNLKQHLRSSCLATCVHKSFELMLGYLRRAH